MSQIHRGQEIDGGAGAGEGMGSQCFMRTEFQFGKMKKVLEMMVGMVA